MSAALPVVNKAIRHVHYSVEWSTPRDFYERLNAEFRFTLDAAAQPWNAKCERFYTPEQDGLAQSWAWERVWLNPPYGRGIGRWAEKAARAAVEECATVVALFPPNVDARWFHDHVVADAAELRFVRGRLRFQREGEQVASRPVGGNILAVYLPGGAGPDTPIRSISA